MTMTTACGVCGKPNRQNAKFCVRCAARIGVEPLGQSMFGAAAAGPNADAPHDAAFDASRAAHLRSADAREPVVFWVRAGIAGLVLLIGFVAWCLYILTVNKAVPPSPISTTSVPLAPAATAEPKSLVEVPPVAQPVAQPRAPPRIATSEPRPPATQPPAATQPPSSLPTTAPSSARAALNLTGAPEARAADAPRDYARSRPRKTAAPPADSAPSNFTWNEPSQPPARTSMPDYKDSGPPIIQGPGPRYASSPPLPEVPPRNSLAPAQAADSGPPIAPGPGPRYDYSTPGALPR
ncbi:hypothetical protein WKW80_20685 [Variovorax humicola]|uniref:Zinc ribbon domain-containing protein n=1 Tax=Variovorax humicola TaxID=1769758 RepID=A0ABU8W2Y4_9BURK